MNHHAGPDALSAILPVLPSIPLRHFLDGWDSGPFTGIFQNNGYIVAYEDIHNLLPFV